MSIAIAAGVPKGARRLTLLKPDGSELRALTPPGFPGNQAWSPDGEWLVYDANADGVDDSSTGRFEIYKVRRDGSDVRRLTSNEVNDWGPSWSPDGSTIAFCSGLNNQYEIYLMPAEGGDAVRLTRLVYP